MATSNVWTNPIVAFTPQGGSSSVTKRTTSAAFSDGTQLLTFSGDTDRYMTISTAIMHDPSITISGANVAAYIALSGGGPGTLVVTCEDAKNLSGSGVLTATLVNAVPNNGQGNIGHVTVSTGSVVFSSFSTDGTTNPLSLAIAV